MNEWEWNFPECIHKFNPDRFGSKLLCESEQDLSQAADYIRWHR